MTRAHLLHAISGIGALALATSPAIAQDVGSIVVTGESATQPEEVRSLVQQLAETHGPDVPATRFFDALCLSVTGLNAAGNEWLKARIESNATEIGLPVQASGCRTNAVVLINDDPHSVIEQIKRDVPALLPRDNHLTVERQLADGKQVIVWYNEENRNQGGRRNGAHQSILGQQGSGNTLNVTTRVNNNNWPSRSELSHSRGVQSAAILFDGAIVEGMVIDRLADYATIRLLAPDLIPLEGAAQNPESVTAPFPQEGGPETLTRFDRSYLTALYSMRPNAPAIRLARAVAEEFESGE